MTKAQPIGTFLVWQRAALTLPKAAPLYIPDAREDIRPRVHSTLISGHASLHSLLRNRSSFLRSHTSLWALSPGTILAHLGAYGKASGQACGLARWPSGAATHAAMQERRGQSQRPIADRPASRRMLTAGGRPSCGVSCRLSLRILHPCRRADDRCLLALVHPSHVRSSRSDPSVQSPVRGRLRYVRLPQRCIARATPWLRCGDLRAFQAPVHNQIPTTPERRRLGCEPSLSSTVTCHKLYISDSL